MAYGNLNVDTITGSGASSVIVNNGTNNVAGFTTGNNLQMLQNGGGIVFSNSSALTNSTLNDYETGTWAPTAVPASGSLTAYTSSGQYTKVGNTVYVLFNIILSNVGTASGFLGVGGLPFTASKLSNTAQYAQIPFVVRETYATGNIYLGYMNGGGTGGTISTTSNGAIAWTNTYTYMGSLSYQANF